MRRDGMVAVMAAVLASSCGLAMAGLATLETFGLTDGYHTNTSGQSSNPMNLYSTTAEMPFINGWASYYYPGIPAQGMPGRTAWIRNTDGTLTTIGLYGAEYTNTSLNHYSSPGGETSIGVCGTSTLYSGANSSGQATWYFDGTQTVEVGLIGGSYLSGSTRNSTVSATPSSPLVSGTSRRTTGGTNSKGGWVYDPATLTTTQVGFYDAMHTGTSGLVSSAVITRVGQYATGYSERYNGGGTSLGRSAWLYDSVSNIQTRVGLTGGIYTSGSREYSSLTGVNVLGQSIGYSSANYDSTASYWQGQAAWTRSPSGTMTTLSLSGAQYVSPLGYHYDAASYMNAGGMVAGYTMQWSNSLSGFDAADAWLYADGAYQVIPVPVAGSTTGFNSFRLLPWGINNEGVVAGIMQRRNASGTAMGPMPWVYINGVTYATGIYDSAHQSPTGRTMQTTSLVGGTLTVGTAAKYAGTESSSGYDVWVFDHQTHITTPLALSNYSDAYGDNKGSTTAAFATPDGWVGGYYDYPLGGNVVTMKGFLWSSQTGLIDFDSLFPGGLAGQGISYVNWVSWVTPTGDIYATVTRTDGSTAAAIFGGAVPEPGVVMFSAAVSTLALSRRARKRVEV